ncbi:hypothetical protein BU26DRAFT_549751 [Trematosphaeria pertusa]|uniref:Uncharacterized protein n=1 Tax=Trematosphaeria pertusa TaxID=390896 RepID=A0A6A6IN06_9PLEO|nr:uncharacterized protein BU26DRAFT_549751 [Trematosphaeria pertusa]KAF2251202.1 hypothetical protein BU26DRAFT_549751 [Trematosphaeria pertusa]
MSTFSLEALDRHIENLRSQLQFLNETLDATDHNAPDWLATNLVSLRNKSGRLQDDMQRFRDQIESEGLGVKKTSTKKQRLSVEGMKPESPTHSLSRSASQNRPTSPTNLGAHPPPEPPQPEDGYVARQVDVTEEVNRRLHESRLRRLMDSPSTAQKRKYDVFEDTRMESGGDTEDDGEGHSERERSPVKRLKASRVFEPVLKRKEDRLARGDTHERNGDRADVKRRKVWPYPA